MPDLLLALLLGLAVLAIVHLVLRWVARADQGARDRDVLDRVYYPTRGRNKDVPSFRRRRAMGGRQARHGRNDEWMSDLDASEWEDELP